MGLLDLARLRVFLDRDGGVVDRPEIAHETRPGYAQPHLKIAPRTICLLRLQHLTDGIADRDQLRDDPDVLFRDTIPGPALADGNRHGRSVEHLHQALGTVEGEAALANRPALGLQVDDLGEFILQVDVDGRRFAVIDIGGQELDGSGKRSFETLPIPRPARIGLAEWP
ncbi:hypothetical protein D3C71_1377690 [compost metagenome]